MVAIERHQTQIYKNYASESLINIKSGIFLFLSSNVFVVNHKPSRECGNKLDGYWLNGCNIACAHVSKKPCERRNLALFVLYWLKDWKKMDENFDCVSCDGMQINEDSVGDPRIAINLNYMRFDASKFC